MTTTVDWNLLPLLDALLEEGSVTRAADRTGLTIPAMSRALGRLRLVTGDALLVRAGRGLVLTPAAQAMKPRVHEAALNASAALTRTQPPSLLDLERTLVIRAEESVAATLAGALATQCAREAPGLSVVFVGEGAEDIEPLRDGRVDLDVGVRALEAPELRSKLLFKDSFVCVTSTRHVTSRGSMTVKRLVESPHVAASRTGRARGPLDVALERLGLVRRVALVVPGFLAAVHAAVASPSFIATVPEALAHALATRLPLVVRPLPLELPVVPVSLSWHPRLQHDLAHRWLRDRVAEALATVARTRTR